MNTNTKITILKNLYSQDQNLDPLLTLKFFGLSDDIEEYQDILSHQQIVSYAYKCACDAFKYIDKQKNPKTYLTSKKCLDLVQKWLKDNKSVSKEELKNTDAAACIANAVYVAAYATHYAANAAAYAAWAACYATNAAYYHHNKSKKHKQQQIKRNAQHLIEILCYEEK